MTRTKVGPNLFEDEFGRLWSREKFLNGVKWILVENSSLDKK